ncbi:hypothetical protein DER46DRAFT_362136 [Fusarium sp. MPI-SDFR-AT-0072]|nr:hypothetical protein DER46DRAFT_362136 [Fusarium sp. MPI-SDFR-AT-0072]
MMLMIRCLNNTLSLSLALLLRCSNFFIAFLQLQHLAANRTWVSMQHLPLDYCRLLLMNNAIISCPPLVLSRWASQPHWDSPRIIWFVIR